MLEWTMAAAVFALLVWAMTGWLKRMKARPRRPGGGGFGIALMMIFASVFDPAKAAAIEQLDRQKDTEGSEEGESGAGPD